jgi:hypothetical protein
MSVDAAAEAIAEGARRSFIERNSETKLSCRAQHVNICSTIGANGKESNGKSEKK